VPSTVARLDCDAADGGRLRLELEDGAAVEARAVVLAAGARYRRLDVEGLERFEGRGISYWASPIEARMARGQEVLLVGGGNSAGQAAVYLAEHASRVRVLVRRPLQETMSQYLVDRIAAASNIEVAVGAAVTGLAGGEALERVRWRGPGGEREEAIRHLFLFIGADPATGWLPRTLSLPRRTGRAVGRSAGAGREFLDTGERIRASRRDARNRTGGIPVPK